MAERNGGMKEQAVREVSAGYWIEAGAVNAEDVPPGYKRTEVGVIPNDWTVVSLGTLGHWWGGATPSMRNPSYWENGDIPWISSGDVKSSYLSDTQHKITKIGLESSSASLLPNGAIIVVTRSGILRKFLPVAQLKVSAAINQDIKGLVPNRNIDGSYVLYALTWSGPAILKTCQKSGTTVESIDYQWLKGYSMPLPGSIEEQRAIATALSDADALIASLDRLIAKKRAIKQAAMQQLLTGQTRLPGFTGEWQTRRLGDFANIKTGERNNQDKIEDGQYPFFVRSENVEKINSYSYDCEAIAVPGEGRIGDIFHYINGKFDVHQRVYAITHFRSNIEPKFVYYSMSQNFGDWAMQNTVKATVDSLRLPVFQKFEMNIPPKKDEQTAIATLLSDMDSEIEALQQRREKTRQIKQGMMQQLLTGRVRLVAPEEAAA